MLAWTKEVLRIGGFVLSGAYIVAFHSSATALRDCLHPFAARMGLRVEQQLLLPPKGTSREQGVITDFCNCLLAQCWLGSVGESWHRAQEIAW